jgi:hypothetical protein
MSELGEMYRFFGKILQNTFLLTHVRTWGKASPLWKNLAEHFFYINVRTWENVQFF